MDKQTNGHKKNDKKRKLVSSKVAAPNKKKKDHFKKVPTVEELNQLQDGSGATEYSNEHLFVLQMEEMIKSTKLKSKYEEFVENWLSKLKGFLNALPSDANKQSVHEITWLNEKIMFPMSNKGLIVPEYKCQFITPKSVHTIGSVAVSTSLGPSITVDIAVEIPKTYFQKADYLNSIYHQKRAIYLCYLARKLRKWEHVRELKFAFFRNDRSKPVLKIKPSTTFKRNLTFCLHVFAEESSFKLSRFLPSTSNVRQSLFRAEDEIEGDELFATPHYNSSVLRDLTLLSNQIFLKDCINLHDTIRDGIVLLKLWLRTRSLDDGFQSFTGHILTMFAIYLVRQKRIHMSMNIYEVVRHIWLNLASSKWHEKGITLHSASAADSNIPSLATFHQHFDVVFVDSTGYTNLCANLSPDIYLRVRDESAKAIQALAQLNGNSFRLLFMPTTSINFQFDHIVTLTEEANLLDVLERVGTENLQHDYCGNWYPQILHIISRVLRKGLSNRISSMHPLPIKFDSWPIDEQCPADSTRTLSFGLILNPEHALNVVDKCALTNETDNSAESEEFVQFWGPKSELRRYQDGSITESCVWGAPNDTVASKRLICKSIVLHLLKHHFDTTLATEVVYVANEFDLAYQLDRKYAKAKGETLNAEHLALTVIKTFDEIAKNLRALTEIPLEISSVLGTSPVFRYCEIHPVMPVAKVYTEDSVKIFQSYRINEGVIQFSATGKWPDDLDAIKRIKTAFYLKIAKHLEKNFDLITRGSHDCVEILKDGLFYRLKISLQKELVLAKKAITSRGITAYRDNQLSLQMEKELVLLPRLNVALHTLYQKFTSYGPAVLIAKRWLYAQLIDPHLWPDECTELLVASLYHANGAITAPAQPQAAFFRFLHLLAFTDWQSEMILIDFNEDFEPNEIGEIEKRFQSDRKSLPALCIVTSCDVKKYSIWSKQAPCVEILAHLSMLAKSAVEYLDANILKGFSPKSLFIPSYDGFDHIIALKSVHVHTNYLYEFVKKTKQLDAITPAAGFNPAQLYLRDLRAAYNNVALFFYNPCGGDRIAVLWRPSIGERQDVFNLSNINGCKYDQKQSNYSYNVEQIIVDFKIIGQDLVDNVEAAAAN